MGNAWISAEGGLFLYACGSERQEAPFHTAVTRLIYGITTEFGEERLRFLRKRIYTDYPLSLFEKNLIKVCAKRSSESDCFASDKASARNVIDIGYDFIPDAESMRCADQRDKRLTPTEARNLALQLASAEMANHSDLKPHLSPRAVGAVLCDNNGRLLGAAVNTNAQCQMRHAEVNLFLNLWAEGQTKIPQGAILYTSLKPCRMCASLILSLIQVDGETAHSIKIIASQDDRGPMGRHHLLDGILKIEI